MSFPTRVVDMLSKFATDQVAHAPLTRNVLGDARSAANAANSLVHPTAAHKRQALGDIGNKQKRLDTGATKRHVVRGTSAVPRAYTTSTTSVATRAAARKPTTRTAPKSSTSAAASAALASALADATVPDVHMDTSEDTVAETATGFSSEMLRAAGIEDIDSADSENPQLVSEYVSEIYEHLWAQEITYKINPTFLSKQKHITSKMRSVLLDWIVDVHYKFKLCPETLYLTVNLIDRSLEVIAVATKNLQLLGVACMLLASKYEEIYTPELRDFIYISDNAYSKDDILEMETLVLSKLQFNLGAPQPLHFLRRDSKAAGVDAKTHTMAKYLMELSLLSYDMCQFKASEIAAASLWTAMKMLQSGTWTPTVEHYSRYSEHAIGPCVSALAVLVDRAPKAYADDKPARSVFAKYKNPKLFKVSRIAEEYARSNRLAH